MPKGAPQGVGQEEEMPREREGPGTVRKKSVQSGAAQKYFEKEELVTRFNFFTEVKQT